MGALTPVGVQHVEPLLLRPKYLRSRRPRGLKHPQRPLIDRSKNTMIDEEVSPRGVDAKLDDGGPAGRNQRALDIRLRGAPDRPLRIDKVKNLSDHVER